MKERGSNMNKKEIDSEQQTNYSHPEIGKKPDYISIDGEKIPLSVFTISYPLGKIADILLWFGESIIVFIKNEWLLLRAADIKYFAGILIMLAAKSEGQEVGAYTGIIPEENPAKVIGTVISETGAAILISVLRSEITRTKKPSNVPIIAPFVGGVGAVQ